MDGIQTTLQAGRIPELEEFKKANQGAIQYVLGKYAQWKALKEKAQAKGADNALRKPGTL